jgi:translation initiation factor 3 subunit C
MSRFFHGDSSSESSSSDEEELYSEEEEEEKAASDAEDSDEEEDEDEDESSSEDEDGAKKSGANRFMRDADSESEDSSDEDRAKIVKSAKDKRLEELEATVKAIENGQKINDWGSISAGRFCCPGRDNGRRLTLSQNSTSSIDKLSSLFRLATPRRHISRQLLSWRTS